jgi:hypothetical protein
MQKRPIKKEKKKGKKRREIESRTGTLNHQISCLFMSFYFFYATGGTRLTPYRNCHGLNLPLRERASNNTRCSSSMPSDLTEYSS